MPLQLDELAALDAPTLRANGQPLMLPADAVDEDPDQSRHEFDSNPLNELAETIRARGVRQPISVRPDLQQAGRWVLNFGARRLIEAPDWLLQAYREGRCHGMNELYELRRLHGEQAQAVETWVAQQGAITRDRIALLRDELEARSAQASKPGAESRGLVRDDAIVAERPNASDSPPPNGAARADPPPTRSPNSDKRIHVEFDGQDYQLVVSVAPDQPGHLYVRPLKGRPLRLAPAARLKLLGFVGG